MKKASIMTLICATAHITFAMEPKTPEELVTRALGALEEAISKGDERAQQVLRTVRTDLDAKVKNPQSTISDVASKLLKTFDLIDSNGNMPEPIRKILLEKEALIK